MGLGLEFHNVGALVTAGPMLLLVFLLLAGAFHGLYLVYKNKDRLSVELYFLKPSSKVIRTDVIGSV